MCKINTIKNNTILNKNLWLGALHTANYQTYEKYGFIFLLPYFAGLHGQNAWCFLHSTTIWESGSTFLILMLSSYLSKAGETIRLVKSTIKYDCRAACNTSVGFGVFSNVWVTAKLYTIVYICLVCCYE